MKTYNTFNSKGEAIRVTIPEDDEEPTFFTMEEIRKIVGGLQAMDKDDLYRRNVDDRDDLEER